MRRRDLTEGNKSQVLVSYIGDLHKTPPDDVLIVAQDADYVRACHKLSQLRKSDADLKIWLRSKSHFSWLRDFTEQIGCPSIFEEKTPRLMLGEQWNVELPDWLSDDDVIKHRLLEIEIGSGSRINFETRFLVHFMGDTFQGDLLNSTNLVSVIKALVSDEAKSVIKERPLLSLCLKKRCEQWAGKSSEKWVKEICKQLPEDSYQVWQWLSLWAGLHGYPGKLLEYVLDPEQVQFVRKIPSDAISGLPIEFNAREQILTQIELLFEEVRGQITSSDEFHKVVAWTSGRLSQEYQLVSSILKSGQFSPTSKDIQSVREKFESCPGLSESQLNSLIYCVKPNRPTLLEPGKEWGSSEWIRWTTKEYMPYRTWQVHNSQYDEDVEKMVGRFSDFYISEYTNIHKDLNLSLIYCLEDISLRKHEKDLIIILLIDSLPLEFFELLDKSLRNVGFSQHGLNYRFAGLPTITEYNKTAVLSGAWQGKMGNYEAILKERSTSDWGEKKVVYLSNLKSFSEMMIPEVSTIVVFNFTDGDELLHSDVESKNTTYDDELYRLYSRIAEAVNRLSQVWQGSKEQITVLVVTDHGACRILTEEKQSFDSVVVKKLFADERHRFSAVSKDQMDEIPQNLWSMGYRFKWPFASEETIFFLPRGHNTVRDAGKIKGYLHGGVTPEEVIVPTAIYKLIKTAWKKPAVRFLNLDLERETGRAKFYIQRVVTLEIEVQNSNTTDLHIHRATIITPEADLKSFEPLTIPAENLRPLKIGCYFKKSALGEKPLEIEIAYEISGEQFTLPLRRECEFKSAMVSGFSLKDL
jgi:hypothetical protein